ncbi:hypothetical protein EXIGLDRAFT_406953 [Exidia glandulosa HHB12029]|uniref:Uncharacterized protein n=1 Tax=Exidia glandulosa HHB12029 TaxID=1314781 RepID=A0A165BIH6_EXIGL|nr:hypothetical protein EXIGLDRAFT_406953 [Exidia glandulosa HHB12029]
MDAPSTSLIRRYRLLCECFSSPVDNQWSRTGAPAVRKSSNAPSTSLIRRLQYPCFFSPIVMVWNGRARCTQIIVFSPVPRSVQLGLFSYTSTYRIAGTLHWNFERSRGRFTAPIGVLGQPSSFRLCSATVTELLSMYAVSKQKSLSLCRVL